MREGVEQLEEGTRPPINLLAAYWARVHLTRRGIVFSIALGNGV